MYQAPVSNRLYGSRTDSATLPAPSIMRTTTTSQPRKQSSFCLALRVVGIASTVLSMITLSATHSFEATIALFCSLVFTLILYMRDDTPIQRVRNRSFDATTRDMW